MTLILTSVSLRLLLEQQGFGIELQTETQFVCEESRIFLLKKYSISNCKKYLADETAKFKSDLSRTYLAAKQIFQTLNF